MNPADFKRLLGKYRFGDDCWEWQASRTTKGYGYFYLGKDQKKHRHAHRVMYEVFVGPIPDGMELDHLCRNRGCGRPDHLEPVTPAENKRRGLGSGNALKASCPQGHPYSGLDSRGGRICHPCKRESERQRRERNLA